MIDYDQIENELEIFERGRLLRSVVVSPAWEVLVGVLRDYKDRARDELISRPPGDPDVPIIHASASALEDLFNKFQQDVANAVNVASNPSDDLREYLSMARRNLDVKAVMEAQTPSMN